MADVKTGPEATAAADSVALARRDESAIAERGGVVAALAFADLSDRAFEARLGALKKMRTRTQDIQKALMHEGIDFGTVPGTDKPTLLKPGSEILMRAYDLAPTFHETELLGDGKQEPHIRIITKCKLHLGDENGVVVAEGIGAANSFEKKYRYRLAKLACPTCGQETIKRSKFPPRDQPTAEKGWYCHQAAGGCGAEFGARERDIVDQERGYVDNPDPYDVENTLHKMAAKRAQIDATLRYTATSGLFTQDVEDLDDDDHGSTRQKQNGGTRQQGQQSAQNGTQQRQAGAGTTNGTAAGQAQQASATSSAAGAQQATNGKFVGYPADNRADDAPVSAAENGAFWNYVATEKASISQQAVATWLRDTYKLKSASEMTVGMLRKATLFVRGELPVGEREPGAEG